MPMSPSDVSPTAWVITVSDRCSVGLTQDQSGPLAAEQLTRLGIHVTNRVCTPDDIAAITSVIQAGIDAQAAIIFTTGGTGIAPRDRTPEATRPFITLPLERLAQAVTQRGYEKGLPTALLSRGLVGIAVQGPQQTLIVNAPGSIGGVKDAIEVLAPVWPHIVDQLAGGDH